MIVTDVRFRDLAGRDLVARIRASARTATTPIVLYSGDESEVRQIASDDPTLIGFHKPRQVDAMLKHVVHLARVHAWNRARGARGERRSG